MRRHHTAPSPAVRRFLAPVALTAAVALLATGCSSSSEARKTVLETVTASSLPASTGSSSAPGTAVTVPGGGSGSSSAGGPGSSGSTAAPSTTSGASGSSSGTSPSSRPVSSRSSAPSSSDAPSSTGGPSITSAGPIVKVNPLNIDCARVLTAADVKRVLNKTINNSSARTKFGAQANISSSGAVRCAYGIVSGQQKASLRVTQYKTVAAADAQVKVTVDSETGLGAKVSTATVGGQPGNVMLRAGGLVNVRYGTWVLAVAAADGTLSGDPAAQMAALGDLVLKRILATA